MRRLIVRGPGLRGPKGNPGAGADITGAQIEAARDEAVSAAAEAIAVLTPLELAGKGGAAWWDSVFAPPATDDTPTVTVGTAGAIVGGTTVAPTADYAADPSFRYDGCAAVISAGTGLVAPAQPAASGAAHTIIPEFVTSPGCNKVDVKFTLNGAGSTFGVRVVVNGKWVTLPLQWFNTTASTVYFVRLTFPTAKARSVRVETVNSANFGGVVVPSGETVTRLPGEVRRRMVIWGDSYTVGANGNTTTDPNTNGCSRFETFAYYLAKLLGCDSVINLGIGGTGWVNPGSFAPFGARVPDILAASPHIVLACGSRNDATSTASAVYAAAVAALTQLADVPVVEVCGISDDGSTTGTIQPGPLNEVIRQAARTVGRHFNDMLGVVTPALKNTADTVHPSIIGAQVLAARFYASLDRSRIDNVVEGAVGGRASVDLTLAASPAGAAALGATITLTATQSTNRAGRVYFYAGTTLLGSSAIVAGVATITTSSLTAGTYTFSAQYRPTNSLLVKSATAPPVTGYTVSANLGFVDTFTRADGAVGSTENGKAYTTTGTGSWVVASNKLVNSTVSGGNSYCTADAGSPNGTHQVTIGGTVPNGAYLIVRYVDSTNLLRITVQSGQIVLQQIVANVTTTLFTGSAGAWVAGDVMSVVLAGDTVTVKKNGTAVTGLNGVSTSTFNTATKHGIGHGTAGTGVTYDDLSFVAA